MPWKKDADGNSKYVVSKYVKEELPTWDEVYNQFYKGQIYTYDPDNPDHQAPDPYWKIPKRAFLLAVVANQFNKMILEDEDTQQEIEQLYDYINKTYDTDIDFIRFVLTPNQLSIGAPMNTVEELKNDWLIYTISNPNGDPNPFITNMDSRINIRECRSPMKLGVQYHTNSDSNTMLGIVLDENGHWGYDDVQNSPEILEIMIQRFKKYFENGVGWKSGND